MSKDIRDTSKKNKLWQFPWGNRESFLIAFFLMLTGFLIQLLLGGGVRMPAWPMNIAIILIFIIYFVLVHFLIKHPVVKWLSSTYAAIAAVSAFTVMVLLLGFIPQGPLEDPRLIDKLGLTSVTSSWAYLMCALYLLVVLGFTIIRRIKSFSIRNMAFILNHVGLWIVVVAASLGSADMWKLTMQLETKHPTMQAYDSRGQSYNLDFGMVLLDFHIDEYPPELGLIRNSDFTLKMEKGGKLATVEEGTSTSLEGYTITVVRYIPFAGKYGDVFDTTSRIGAARAAYVKVEDEGSAQKFEGWVSDGSFGIPASILKLNNELSIAMTQFRPKKYNSDIRIYHDMDNYEDFHIEVNKPATIQGWKIYQTGYDEKMGRWSEISIIELVKDPWLPIVYIGIFMILLGTLYLIWMGKGRTKTKKA